jgi:hypothetical protein
MNEPVKLNLSHEGLDYIWSLLLRAPYGDVAQLIADINRQVADQAEPPTPDLPAPPVRQRKPRAPRKPKTQGINGAAAVQ